MPDIDQLQQSLGQLNYLAPEIREDTDDDESSKSSEDEEAKQSNIRQTRILSTDDDFLAPDTHYKEIVVQQVLDSENNETKDTIHEQMSIKIDIPHENIDIDAHPHEGEINQANNILD